MIHRSTEQALPKERKERYSKYPFPQLHEKTKNIAGREVESLGKKNVCWTK